MRLDQFYAHALLEQLSDMRIITALSFSKDEKQEAKRFIFSSRSG